MNNVYFLLDNLNLCDGPAKQIWTIFGYIILGIQIAVPLILIIYGMVDMARAVMKEKEDDIKKAQQLLVKKVIAAVICFLVIAFTKIVVGLVTTGDWESCVDCAFHPINGEGCGISKPNVSPQAN